MMPISSLPSQINAQLMVYLAYERFYQYGDYEIHSSTLTAVRVGMSAFHRLDQKPTFEVRH